MKIALCLSGQPRNVKKGYEYINKNIIEFNKNNGHEIDIFIHTWFSKDMIDQPIYNSGGHVSSDAITYKTYSDILELYHPLASVIQHPVKFDELNYNENKFEFINVHNSLSQRFSVSECISMAFLYDPIYSKYYDGYLRMRFDWAIKEPFNIDQYPLSYKTIYLPNDCPHMNGVNDQFAYGEWNGMQIYSGLMKNIHNLYNSYSIPFVDELLLYKHLEINNVKMKTVSIPYTLLRG